MTHTPYAHYRDSQIDWIGKIPEHWKVKKGKYCFSEIREKNINIKEKTILSLSYGKIIIKDKKKLTGLVPENFETYQIVQPNDIIIRSTDLQNDKKSLRTGLVKNKGIITSAYINLRAKKNITPNFLHYLLYNYDILKIFYGLGSGLRQNLSYKDFKYLPIPLPPLEEQKKIAEFLDKKSYLIDKTIHIHQQQIILLRKRKESLIQKIVTQGLNPHARLKDSGIDWIGKIPENWEVRKLKQICYINPTTHMNLKNNENVDFIPMASVSVNGYISTLEKKKYIEVKNGFTKFINDDLLIAKITPCFENQKISLVNIEENYGFGSTEFHIVRCTKKIFHKYLFFYMRQKKIIQLGEKQMVGSAGQKRIPSNFIKKLPIPLPPLEEQKKIADFLDKECAKIEHLIDLKEKQITALKTYRTSLIDAAVTGKIKVF